MAHKNRKKKKKKALTIAKIVESLSFLKPRIVLPPIGYSLKSKKQYNRQKDKIKLKKTYHDE